MFTGEIRGLWWLPESPEQVVSGTLTVEYGERPTLLFTGPLDPSDDAFAATRLLLEARRDVPVVHGRSADGRPVTIGRGTLALRQMHLDEPDSATYELTAPVVYIGAHLDPKLDTFERCELVIERLTDWHGFSPFTLSREHAGDPRSALMLRGELPERIVGTVHGGTIKVASRLQSKREPRHAVAVGWHVAMQVNLDQGRALEGWLEEAAGPIQRLISLSVTRPVEFDEFWLWAGNQRVEVIWRRRLRAQSPDRALAPDEVMFTAESVRADLGRHFGAWIDAAPRLKPVVDMFFATRYAETMFEEDRFQNLVQAAEAYHRRLVANRPDEAGHAERMRRVLDSAPPDLRDWLDRTSFTRTSTACPIG